VKHLSQNGEKFGLCLFELRSIPQNVFVNTSPFLFSKNLKKKNNHYKFGGKIQNISQY